MFFLQIRVEGEGMYFRQTEGWRRFISPPDGRPREKTIYFPQMVGQGWRVGCGLYSTDVFKSVMQSMCTLCIWIKGANASLPSSSNPEPSARELLLCETTVLTISLRVSSGKWYVAIVMKDHDLNLLNILAYIVCSGEHIIVISLRMSFAVLRYIPPRTANP